MVSGTTVDEMLLRLAKTMEAHTLDSPHCKVYLELLQGSSEVRASEEKVPQHGEYGKS